jgi:hypothetical protein
MPYVDVGDALTKSSTSGFQLNREFILASPTGVERHRSPQSVADGQRWDSLRNDQLRQA